MSKDRKAAYQILKEIEQEGAYSNLAVSAFLSKNEVDSPAFIRELVYGVLRQQILIDYNIDLYAKKIKTSDRIILRMGIYQLCFMNSVSDYAAVNESVELSKGNGKFINAVLRNFIRDGKELRSDSLSVKYSCHESIVGLLNKAYGEQQTEEILKHSLVTPKLSERVNKSGLISIQGKSSQLAVETLAPKPGETVIDVCAAPGGKSLYAADLMNNEGEIYAFDLYEHRVALIKKEADRLGVSIIKAEVHDSTALIERLKGKADAVICDAPCSGLGTIAKKPEIKLKGLSPDLPELYKTQAKILEVASGYLKENGRLLYSTCTINPRENEKQIDAFMERHKDDFELVSSKQIFPHDEYDGFYIALIKRTH